LRETLSSKNTAKTRATCKKHGFYNIAAREGHLGKTATKDQTAIRRFSWEIASIDVQLKQLSYFWAKSIGLTTAQWMILLAVRELDTGDGATVTAVADHLHHHSSFVTSQSKQLEKKGLLYRKNSMTDGRVVHMSLTDKASRILAKLADRIEALDEFIFTELGDRQLGELADLLTKIQVRLKKAGMKLIVDT
jgi:DNA-binding MarR family transcriptional regulator